MAEYLAAFSTLLGCESGAQAEFFTAVKSNHADIFTPAAEPETVVNNFKTVVSKNVTKWEFDQFGGTIAYAHVAVK